jgi:hypothetical protein
VQPHGHGSSLAEPAWHAVAGGRDAGNVIRFVALS